MSAFDRKQIGLRWQHEIALAVSAVLLTSCGFEREMQMDRRGGYWPDYNEHGNVVNVFIRQQKLDAMGGAYSEATKAFVENVVKQEGYCKKGSFFAVTPRQEPRGQ